MQLFYEIWTWTLVGLTIIVVVAANTGGDKNADDQEQDR